MQRHNIKNWLHQGRSELYEAWYELIFKLKEHRFAVILIYIHIYLSFSNTHFLTHSQVLTFRIRKTCN